MKKTLTVVGCAAAAVMLLAGTGAAHQGDDRKESPDHQKQTILWMSTTSISLLPTPYVSLKAKLTEADTGEPVVGRRIDFYGGGYALCQADTDRHGWARCNGAENYGLQTLKEIAAGYEAVFTGDGVHAPTAQHAPATIGTNLT
ncbi:hypothetical protein GCM10010365_70820 [Streptomyces poonensis]|uniref:Uncharacterized protein n=2 Tax=Streptomyces poonensis TaxID=68255 RepID=A0A918QC89_9ACTN|nr:hypothetical protein GCM10010365_70820 [Streptomyces poonensis]GLJ92902.1 hypothetical protein GCM10017589_55130 [Streptomyces poonensis]